MIFEEYAGNPSGQKDSAKGSNPGDEDIKEPDSADNVLMDYEQLAEAKGLPASAKDTGPHIGLIGGQSRDDDEGIDISQYTGPQSRTSTQLDDPKAPFHTGPGNGVNNDRENDSDTQSPA